MYQLRFENSDRRPVWLASSEFTIGTGAGCSLVVDELHLHAHHATLDVEQERVVLRNLVGDALIRVNGVPVTSPRPLTHGDLVHFGFTQARLVDPKLGAPEITEIPAPQEEPWTLEATSTALAGKVFAITKATSLGRSMENDISLKVAHLSRHHARLSVTERGLQVEDLNSANGTFVNGQRIERAMLKPGDQVRFDTLAFRVSGPADADVTTVRPVLRAASPTKPAAVARQPHREPERRRPTGPQPQLVSGVESEVKPRQNTAVGMALILAAVVGACVWYFLQK